MKKKLPLVITIFFLALTNYQLAKLGQRALLATNPEWSYQWTIIIPWLFVCATPVLLNWSDSGVRFNFESAKTNWKLLLSLSSIVLLGLLLFVSLGITRYFHSVKYPLIFFLVTPLVEELLFRGWIYGQLQKTHWFPVIGSAMLFGLHHLQYFNYRPTPFALFQIGYTFVLGWLFGLMRKKSDSMYLSLMMHILINWATVNF